MFLNQVAAVARLSPESLDNDKEQYATIMGRISINIQPATAELTAMAEGVYGQTFQAFTAVSGIAIGDQITVSGTGNKFIVKGVNDWHYAPIPHYELVLFKGDN